MRNDIEEFSFDKWYSTFEKDAVEAIIVPIPKDTLEYLCVGPMILPKEALVQNVSSSTRSYSAEWSDEDDDELEQPSFPSFSNKLKNAVNSLGGEVFIKSNWHAPKDATWIITSRTLKCRTTEDIYWLLKSSDIVCKDLSYEFKLGLADDNSDKHCVVIKRWIDLHPGCEFRCFVKEHNLIGISQRDCTSFYAHINARKYDIIKDTIKFFHTKVKQKFPCANYVFDIARLDNNSVLIIDFQPFDKNYTDSLLFDWEELHKMKLSLDDDDINSANSSELDPEFRFIAEDVGVQPKPCHHAGMPYEVKKLCSEMRGMSLLEYLREEVERQDSQPE